jgi:signal transduction histidine kinase
VVLCGLGGAFVAVERITVDRLRSTLDSGLQTQVREWRRSVAGVPLGSPAEVSSAATAWLALQRDHPSTQLQVVDVAGGDELSNHPGVLGPEHAREHAEQVSADASPTPRVTGLLDAPEGLTTADTVELGLVRVVTVPIRWDGRQVGVLRVAESLQPLQQTQAQLRRTFLLVGVVAVLLGAAAATALAGVALRPLRRLATVVTSVDAGELDRRVGPLGSGEVASLARAFDRMLDRLQGAFAQQSRFVADASHELRTPLSVLRAQIELLADEQDESARRAGVQVLRSRLRVLERLVGDLLALARAEVEQLHRPEPVPLVGFFADLDRDLPLLGARSYRVEHCGGTVNADPDRLTQVVHNLVRNAVEHTAPGDPIAVLARATGDRLVLVVQDEGSGIPPVDLPHVFERFYRADPARPQVVDRDGTGGGGAGTGLGLAIAAALVRAHGGQLRAWSEPGRGTRMTVELPGYTPAS